MPNEIVWETQTRRIDELLPWDKNPRLLSEEQRVQLEKSIDSFGVVEPLAINQDGVLVGGHQRAKVLGAMYGPEYEVDVRVPSRQLSEEELVELNIRLNKNTGSFDYGLLQTEFKLDDLMSWGFKPFDISLPDEKPEPMELWEGMPEFQEEPAVIRDGGQIIVHFRSMDDRMAFGELMGQSVTPSTRYLWHPKKEHRIVSARAFVDEDYES